MPKVKTAPDIKLEAISLSPETAATLSGVSVRSIYRLLAAKVFTARRKGAARSSMARHGAPISIPSRPTSPENAIPNAPQATSARKRTRRTRQ